MRVVEGRSSRWRDAGRRRVPRRPVWLDGPLIDFHLLVSAAGLLLIIGLMMVFSAASIPAALGHRSPWTPGIQQALWAALGLFAGWAVLGVPTAALRRWSGWALLVMVVLLLAVLVPGLGVRVAGARKWFDLGVGYLQPSEITKLVFAVWGAHLVALRARYLTTRTLLLPIVPVFLVLAALIVVEPDLGSTVSFLLVLIGLLWAGGAPRKVWLWLLGTGAVAAVALIGLAPYRVARFTSFLHPFADPTGTGFQEIQGFYALASGGFWGVGLGNGQAKWGLLPNDQSDYIFAIIGNELGFLGCLVVVVLYGVLAYVGLRIATRSVDVFAQVASTVITVWLIGQALMNMGYVVGLLPVTGVTLPLISQGGTSLVLTLASIGLLARFARAEPEAVRFLRDQPAGRLRRLLLPAPDPPDAGGLCRQAPGVRGADRACRSRVLERDRLGRPRREGPERQGPRPGVRVRRTAAESRTADSPRRRASR